MRWRGTWWLWRSSKCFKSFHICFVTRLASVKVLLLFIHTISSEPRLQSGTMIQSVSVCPWNQVKDSFDQWPTRISSPECCFKWEYREIERRRPSLPTVVLRASRVCIEMVCVNSWSTSAPVSSSHIGFNYCLIQKRTQITRRGQWQILRSTNPVF